MKPLIFILVSIFFTLITKANYIEAGDAVLYVADNLPKEDFNEELEIYIGLIGVESEDFWIVVADPSPCANWGHRVIWHYIPCYSEDGNPKIVNREEHDWLPNDVELFKFYHQPQPEMASYNLYTERDVPIRNISPAIHQYAIILSGGLNRDSDHPRYWNDCSYIYRILRNHFNVPKDQIFVAMSGGPEKSPESYNTSHSLDLDGDKVNDICYAASIEDLENIFSLLKDKLTSSDHLFLYVIDHGGYDAKKKSSFICLWNNQFLYPDKLNDWFDSLNVASINCVFGQCNGGGFIEPLKQPNRIITTACKYSESSYTDKDQKFDTFVDTWASGLLNCTSLNDIEVDPADSDNDGYISMKEAFNFANLNDPRGIYGLGDEHPQYYSGSNLLSYGLCFDRFPVPSELYIRDNLEDHGNIQYNTSQLYCDSPDIWISTIPDCATKHENPEFGESGEIENYIYVRISNKSTFEYNPIMEQKYLHLNWSTGTPANTYSGFAGYISDKNGNRTGGVIKSILIDKIIPSKGQATLCIPWKSHGSPNEIEDRPKTILASISDKPYGFIQDVWWGSYPKINSITPLVRPSDYSNLAIKSFYYPHKVEDNQNNKNEFAWKIDLNNVSGSKNGYGIFFQSGNNISIFDYLDIHIKGPEDIKVSANPNLQSMSDIESDKPASREVIIDSSVDYTFTYEGEILSYITLETDQVESFDLNATLNNIDSDFNGELIAIMSLFEYSSHKIVGSYSIGLTIEDGKIVDLHTLNINDQTPNDNCARISDSIGAKISSSVKLYDGTVSIQLENAKADSSYIMLTSIPNPQHRYIIPLNEDADDYNIKTGFTNEDKVIVSLFIDGKLMDSRIIQ